MGKRLARCAVAATGTVASMGGGFLLAAPHAVAAQTVNPVQCGDITYMVSSNNNNSQNGGWGVGQVVAQPGAHGIPVSFTGVLTDESTHTAYPPFSATKGNGNANQNQPVTQCTETLTGTVSELTGGQIPSSDPGSLALTIGVVLKQ